MTSGSCWTHFTVTDSAALVDELQEGVPLARVAREATVPLVLGDGRVDGSVGLGRDRWRHRAGDGCAHALAQVDQVVERNALAAIDRRGPVGVFAGRGW